MSFVPNPTQANASSNNKTNSHVKAAAALPPNFTGQGAPPSAAAENNEGADENAEDLIFKIRTYDVYWVEKSALMYRDGISKVRDFRRHRPRTCTFGDISVGFASYWMCSQNFV